MAVNIINRLNFALQRFERALGIFLGRGFPPQEGLCVVALDHSQSNVPQAPIPLDDILDKGFLWAVPKSRRTIEKRLNRKFGDPERVWKPLVPKKHLLVCTTCGHHYEAGILCVNCYNKVKQETEEMQAAIQAELGLSPVEKDVVVLYQGEKQSQPEDYWKDKRVVELPKKRPIWFNKNLLQQTTQKTSDDSTEVKPPTELA